MVLNHDSIIMLSNHQQQPVISARQCTLNFILPVIAYFFKVAKLLHRAVDCST